MLDSGRDQPGTSRLPRLRHAGLGLQGPAGRVLQHPGGGRGGADHRPDRGVPAAGADHLRRRGPVPAPGSRAREPVRAGGVREERNGGQALSVGDARQRLAEDPGGAARARRRGAELRGRGPGRAPSGHGLRGAHHHHHRHPVGARPQAGRAVRARQPDLRVLVQQAPAGDRGGHLRPRELHQGRGQHRCAAPRGRPVRRAPAVTAEPYAAAAADLVARSATAYASAVPAQPADDGFFGPASVTWRVGGDLSAPVAGLRSLLVQALHPLAMAGVDQHSGWRRDPVGRLAATSAYTTTVTYGDRASAGRVAGQVRAIHEHVRGVDAVTGRPYAAGDPALLLWVHAALVDSVLAAGTLVGTALSAADSNRYVAEMVTAAELTGVPRHLVPSCVPELREYMAGVRPVLRSTPAAAESMGYMLDPDGMGEEIAELWQDLRDAAIAVLPGWARDLYGYPAPPPLTAERRTEIRQTLGVFDAVFTGEPGVLEARQQLTLRMRAARG